MNYPIIQYSAEESGSTSLFKGLNRTDKGSGGEWLDMQNLSADHYPCLAPRTKHGSILDLSVSADDTETTPIEGKIFAVGEVVRDTGEYQGFTGVILYDGCISSEGETEENFAFLYNGEIRKVGSEDSDASTTERTSLWEYDADTDDITSDEIDEFKTDISRIVWTVAAVGKRYIINGYDPALQRGKYFVLDTSEKYDDLEREVERLVVPSDSQYTYTNVAFGTGDPEGTPNNSEKINYITNTDENNKFSDKFTEGDYITIKTASGNNDTHPYVKAGTEIKYAVVQSIEDEYYSDGETWKRERLYYYAVRAAGQFVKAAKESGVSVTLGTFVPPMSHISVFGKRVWGVNPDEDSVYASVYDTPFKLMNTDTQLDNAMSWQSVLGTADEAVGCVSAVTEMLVMKEDTVHRISGTNASNFTIAGVYKNCGCIDIKSCAEAAGTVFYLGRHGFYSYSGAQPQIISQNLNCEYTKATAACDGIRYFASAIRADTGEHEFLMYYIRTGEWYRWTDTPQAEGFVRIGSETYEAYNDTDGNGKIFCLIGDESSEGWECESVLHFESVNTFKGVNELRIRAEVESPVTVYTRVNDSEEWVKHKTLDPKGRIFCYVIPVRFSPGDFWQYKLTSEGGAVIHTIERFYDEGGARHYVH